MKIKKFVNIREIPVSIHAGSTAAAAAPAPVVGRRLRRSRCRRRRRRGGSHAAVCVGAGVGGERSRHDSVLLTPAIALADRGYRESLRGRVVRRMSPQVHHQLLLAASGSGHLCGIVPPLRSHQVLAAVGGSCKRPEVDASEVMLSSGRN